MSKYPKLNSEYYQSITRQIRSGITRIADLSKERKQLDKMIRSGNFAGDKLREMQEELRTLDRQIKTERDERPKKVKELCDEFIGRLQMEDTINPNDVVEADLRLLTCGIPLTDMDIEAMVERNKNNSTMSQLIVRYLKQDGNRDVLLGYQYVGNDSLIESLNIIPDVCKTFFKYDDGMEGNAGLIYERVMGEGTELGLMFSPEND